VGNSEVGRSFLEKGSSAEILKTTPEESLCRGAEESSADRKNSDEGSLLTEKLLYIRELFSPGEILYDKQEE
jgi:hypothetical protein